MKRTIILGKEFYISDRYPRYKANRSDNKIGGPHCEHEQRIIADLDDYLWKAFSLLQMNKIAGSYVELGSGATVRSSRLALKYSKDSPVYPWRRLFIFDSFQGLPDPTGIDKHPQWIKGDMAVSEQQYDVLLSRHGAVKGRDYVCVPGFFENTLSSKTPTDYGIRKAAFVHIDCDLYTSTVEALNFIIPAMPDGAILSFDDWLCFNGDPDRGEQRAFRELVEKSKGQLDFIPFRSFSWHGYSFIVRRLNAGVEAVEHDEIREQISARLELHHGDIKTYDRIVIYGTGGHTRSLLKEWKACGLPPITAVTNSETVGGDIFEGIPVVSLKSLKKNKRQLIVLSSRLYEDAMHRTVNKEARESSILSVWNPALTKFRSTARR